MENNCNHKKGNGKRFRRLARIILFIDGIIFGMIFARLYTYIIGTCPFGINGIVYLFFYGILLFIIYILLLHKNKKCLNKNNLEN